MKTRMFLIGDDSKVILGSFSFYAFLGWQQEQDHYEAMKKDGYKEFRASFKDCVNADKDKGIKIYHIELRKMYGDL